MSLKEECGGHQRWQDWGGLTPRTSGQEGPTGNTGPTWPSGPTAPTGPTGSFLQDLSWV